MTVDLPSALTTVRNEGIHASRIAAKANCRTQMFVGNGGEHAFTRPLTNHLNTLEAYLNDQAVKIRRG